MTSRFGGYEEQEFIADLYDVTYAHLKDIGFYIDYSRNTEGRILIVSDPMLATGGSLVATIKGLF